MSWVWLATCLTDDRWLLLCTAHTAHLRGQVLQLPWQVHCCLVLTQTSCQQSNTLTQVPQVHLRNGQHMMGHLCTAGKSQPELIVHTYLDQLSGCRPAVVLLGGQPIAATMQSSCDSDGSAAVVHPPCHQWVPMEVLGCSNLCGMGCGAQAPHRE